MFKTMIQRLDKEGVFKAAKVVLFGKPQDGIYQDEYAHILLDITKPYQIPIMANLHFGHAHPKNDIAIWIKCSCWILIKSIIYYGEVF